MGFTQSVIMVTVKSFTYGVILTLTLGFPFSNYFPLFPWYFERWKRLMYSAPKKKHSAPEQGQNFPLLLVIQLLIQWCKKKLAHINRKNFFPGFGAESFFFYHCSCRLWCSWEYKLRNTIQNENNLSRDSLVVISSLQSAAYSILCILGLVHLCL